MKDGKKKEGPAGKSAAAGKGPGGAAPKAVAGAPSQKSKLPKDVRRKCGESGHWGNECPNDPANQQALVVGNPAPVIVQGATPNLTQLG